jgi:Tfp pilus assembly protein PilN
MPQQINLYTPLLLKPRVHFTARSMAQAMALLGLLACGLCAWVLGQQDFREHAYKSQVERMSLERRDLEAALATAREQHDPKQLERSLQAVVARNAELSRRQTADHQTLLRPDEHHSVTLSLLARTLPASAWVTRAQLGPTLWDVQGLTLDPASLHTWILRLQQAPELQGRAVAQLRVEQINGPLAASLTPGAGGLQRPSQPLPADVPVWAFRLQAQPTTAPTLPENGS